MPRLSDDKLLSLLQSLEEDSAAYTLGALADERQRALDQYNREPYGNEEEGWSTIVTSDVQDTVEWVLPDMLDQFVSTDKAVVFEPTRASDVAGADQATDACNYVFYKQNNGFLVLYTAIKDALIRRNCAVMWRKDTKRTKSVIPVTGATLEMLAMVLQESGGEIESATQQDPQPMMDPQTGQPVFDPYTGQPVMAQPLINARVSIIEEKTVVKVEAFDPNDLLIQRDWTSPELTDCPYVCRTMLVTLSDLEQMGFDVTADDLRGSDEASLSNARFRRKRDDGMQEDRNVPTEDESLTEGYLRIEFVLVDADGDGIAERRMILRLKNKILENEEVSHVQIATASPVLVPHDWNGMSLDDVMGDLQQLHTELTRQVLNSAYLANNPRKKVLTDTQGTPYANIDDLLDNRPGGVLRHSRENAITDDITPFVGGQMFPLLEYVDQMRESRTGVSRQSQGLDANALNDRTATAARMAASSAQKRIKLMARIFAELLVKPIFQGILKLLTDGEMEKLAFRLRDEFVEYDPNEWRDSYDMTINVGLGTGDRDQQTAALMQIATNQAGLTQSPFGPLLVTPKTIYNAQAKLVENAGFKNVGDFFVDPGDKQVPPPQAPPDPKIQIEQMRQQADAQKFQAETQIQCENDERANAMKLREQQAELQLQASNDQRDAERAAMQAQFDALAAAREDATNRAIAEMQTSFQRYKTDQDNETRLTIAGLQAQVSEINAERAAQAKAQQPSPEQRT